MRGGEEDREGLGKGGGREGEGEGEKEWRNETHKRPERE